MDYKVSIVVPIYNTERFLDECVNSLLSQTYKNIEIILVDDESPDRCPEKCDTYALLDTRVKVIHKKNGGLSDARNAGIDIATGDFICFIDSDDYIACDMIEQLMETMINGNADISVCTYTREENSFSQGIMHNVTVYSREKSLKILLTSMIIETSAWGKLYKRELFSKIRYPKGKIYEDYATTYRLFDISDRIAYSDSKKYYYRKNPESITGKKFYSKQLQYFNISKEVEEYFSIKYPKYVKHVKNRATKLAISFFKNMSSCKYDNEDDIKFVVRYIRKNFFRYIFCKCSILSKAYGLLICISPKLALKIF